LSKKRLILTKTLVWLLCLLPLARVTWRGWNSYRGAEPDLTANPIEFITLSTGTWTLVFLLTTMAITPLRRITGQPWLIKFRRLIGLFAFFYACLHFTTYIWLDKFFDFGGMIEDIAKRKYITMGFLAFTLLIPLAVTSTAGWIRRLGGRKWNRLHSLIYISAIAAVIHFWWKVKADIREPAIYAAVLAALLVYRLAVWARTRSGNRVIGSSGHRAIGKADSSSALRSESE
jgi:sulfoxide reductase heme-binding subunit YedZ